MGPRGRRFESAHPDQVVLATKEVGSSHGQARWQSSDRTGGASGIGKRTAEVFVEEGARVVIADLNGDGVAAMVAQLGHSHADGVQLDIRDEEAVQTDGGSGLFGALGGWTSPSTTRALGASAPSISTRWRSGSGSLASCLTGTFLCIKQEAMRLIGQGQGGSIINVASMNAIQAAEGFAAYCSAKAGVAMLTKVAALELGRHRIRVNGIGPGLIRTPSPTAHQHPRPGGRLRPRGAHRPRRPSPRTLLASPSTSPPMSPP